MGREGTHLVTREECQKPAQGKPPMTHKHYVVIATLAVFACAGLSARGDVPFGPYHLMQEKLGPPFTLTMAGPKTPEDALRFLRAAREKKVKVLIHLTRGAPASSEPRQVV